MKKNGSLLIVRAGIVAGLYVALSLITFPVASGVIQFRVSEALTLLPLIFPESTIAVTVGCLISNLITGCSVIDVVLGSLITLVASVFTLLIGKTKLSLPLKIFIGGLFPVLLNAFILPVIWLYCYGTGEYLYIIQVLLLILSQSVSIYIIGSLLVVKLKNKPKA